LTNLFILLLTAAALLAGCATPEYLSAKNECTADAYRQFPINNVPTLVNLTRPIQVPTGQTTCTTTYVGVQAFTQCQQVMRTDYVPYQQTVIVDTNASYRNHAVNSCAAQLCVRRFGNTECKK
jgi:hypothetical protein